LFRRTDQIAHGRSAAAEIGSVTSSSGGVTPVTNIEIIQFANDNGSHTLNLDAVGAARATGLVAGGALTINGTSNDTVNLANGVFAGQVLLDDHAYNQYLLDGTRVLLEHSIHAVLTP
jgi:hypothetical protein